MGENIAEALADDQWRCPVCRDICNCSGANCLRAKRNLFPTQQLTHEALQFGWQSVAHYLITTRIVAGADALEIVGQIGEGALGRVLYARNRTGARVDRERESSWMARMNARARA